MYLRTYARRAGVDGADRLGSHALRRGRARDLLDSGASLADDVMLAGEWRSSAVLFYLRRHQLDEQRRPHFRGARGEGPGKSALGVCVQILR